ncbi:hypothetical protein FXO37_12802 [Capsicum annuum]|nr:hypothetical protein FXO37_12802 [Capsicum annuum]
MSKLHEDCERSKESTIGNGPYIWGPSPVSSLGGSRFYVTFINDFRRKEDSVSTSAYLINRGPSVPLGFKILEEVWTGKELKYSHLRTFACTIYVHVDPEKRDKLDSKETTKQVRVELELPKSAPKDVTEETQQTSKTAVKELEVEQVTPEQVWRRSCRTIRAPNRYSPSLNYLLLTDESESLVEALQVEDSIKWEKSMDDKMSSLEKNNTWMLTELPSGKRALLNKWVFRIKAELHGKRRFKDWSAGTLNISQKKYIEKVHGKSREGALESVKWFLRYLRGTSYTSLCFGNGKVILQGFVDDDLCGDVDLRKSTFGYIYTIGGTEVSWMFRLQKAVEDGDMCLEKIEGAKNPVDMSKKYVDVEIDVLTGETTILQSDIIYDCGQSLNPAVDMGQIEGAFVHGIGLFMHEEYITNEDGLMVSNSTWMYKIPTIPQNFNVQVLNSGHHKKRVLSSKSIILSSFTFISLV